MSLRTLWGYELTNADSMPDLIDAETFNEYSAGRFSGDVRITPELESASTAIRNYVGWHLYPSEACRLTMTLQDRRVTFVGHDVLIQLPAKYVTGVDTVTIGGVAYEYTFETNGIVEMCWPGRHGRRTSTITSLCATPAARTGIFSPVTTSPS